MRPQFLFEVLKAWGDEFHVVPFSTKVANRGNGCLSKIVTYICLNQNSKIDYVNCFVLVRDSGTTNFYRKGIVQANTSFERLAKFCSLCTQQGHS